MGFQLFENLLLIRTISKDVNQISKGQGNRVQIQQESLSLKKKKKSISYQKMMWDHLTLTPQ